MAKYKFKPKVGSIILVTARSAPFTISKDVVILVIVQNPNPNDTKKRKMECRPRYSIFSGKSKILAFPYLCVTVHISPTSTSY
jgi:hypothetical protein